MSKLPKRPDSATERVQKELEAYDHLGFSAGTYFVSEKRCYRYKKRIIDYFAATMLFITPNKLLPIGFCSTCYLLMIQIERLSENTFLRTKVRVK